ncbi:MAG: N-acetylneuraminate synthase [Candidatus Omnitrophota bacterium]
MQKIKNKKIYIIAEAGVNHNGDLETAKKMIDAAVSAGASAVKFQAFKAEKITSIYAPKAEYQKTGNNNESQYEMLKQLELDRDAHKALMDYCKEKNIDFLSSPFDLESIDMLAELGLEVFKIPSGEITNLPYLRKIGRLNKKIIISTGMSDFSEIEKVVEVLITSGTLLENITVLHCNTAYPTFYEDVNLKAIKGLRDFLKIPVGYSDHTLGIEVSIAAVALGAEVIEKHFTLDKNMSGPDHAASLEPGELETMVKAIRNIEKSLGSSEKKVSPSEEKNMTAVRKSITAAVGIKKGEVFQENNITAKRPGTGISPMQWDDVLGKHAKRDFEKDELIEL